MIPNSRVLYCVAALGLIAIAVVFGWVVQSPADRESEVIARLEELTGFSHPYFSDVAQQLVKDETSYGVTYDLAEVLEFDQITWGNDKYTLVNYFSLNPALFYRSGNQIERLDIAFKRYPRGINSSRLMEGGSDIFGDRNQNGLADFVIYLETGGNCCPSYMAIFEIDGSTLLDITPDVFDAIPTDLEDIDADGMLDVKAAWYIAVPGGGQVDRITITRWYAWDGASYQDISAYARPFYQADYDELKNLVQPYSGCLLPEYRNAFPIRYAIHQVLIDHYVVGQQQAGWQWVSQMLWGRCSPHQLQSHSAWIQSLRNFISQIDRLLPQQSWGIPLNP